MPRWSKLLLDAPLIHESTGLLIEGEPNEIGIAEAVPDPRGLRRSLVTRFIVAGRHLLQPEGDQQIAVLGAVPLLPRKHALGTREPAAHSSGLSTEEKVMPDPEGRAGRARRVTRVQVQLVSAFQAAPIRIVASENVGRSRQQFQIVGSKRHELVGAGE
jgi:hypothetical protein